jgi:hypothetical protein
MSSELNKIDILAGVAHSPEFCMEITYVELTRKEKILYFIRELKTKAFDFCEFMFFATIVSIWMAYTIKFFLTR